MLRRAGALEPYKILNNIINILRDTLNIEVYSTFSSKRVYYPIKHEFLTVETYFGSSSKTIISIKTYVPKSKGSKYCRELTEQIRNNIKSNNIIGFNGLISFAVNYDKALCAYIQKSQIKFDLLDDEKIFVLIEFGDEKIVATGETTLKISRNVSTYNSPLEGPFCKDLGRTLKKIEGSAVVKQKQFDRLVSLMELGKIQQISMGNQKFNAILQSLAGRPNGKVKFMFLEVRL